MIKILIENLKREKVGLKKFHDEFQSKVWSQ